MSRGDLVIAAFPGDYGKPRPALVIQSDGFNRLQSVTVLPLTSDLYPAALIRINVAPAPTNGLQRRSQIMVDKAATISRTRIGGRIGRLDSETMGAVGLALARFLDIG
ncbi:MAG: type II toxin-antitoxin system PemK/MazF family toxin [Alphaproteobacteria bacterium]